jgi:hypothetical protein
MADEYSSTSSIMPQKKNPDVAELARGKTSIATGELITILTILKAIPYTYNRDLQEITPHLWNAVKVTKDTLSIVTKMLLSVEFKVERFAELAGKNFATATDLADIMVREKHIPFRTAHKIVGRIVNEATANEMAEDLLAAHQVDEPLWVVEHTPGVVPAVALGKGVTPLEWTERGLEGTVFQFAAHQSILRVKHVAVVHRPLGIDFDFVLGLAQRLAQAVDAPIVVGVFQSPGHALVDLYVIGDVAQLIIIFVACAPRGFYLGMHSSGAMNNGLPQFVDVIATQALQIGIGDNRRAVVAHHAVAVTGAGPFGQETAFEIGVY